MYLLFAVDEGQNEMQRDSLDWDENFQIMTTWIWTKLN